MQHLGAGFLRRVSFEFPLPKLPEGLLASSWAQGSSHSYLGHLQTWRSPPGSITQAVARPLSPGMLLTHERS